ncbi:hypothetical protein [Anaeromyxobacter dehalogenans]|uniref:Uncharacterized protein n=1 Tax=Anaeromyxobacter dehalogenans (strain 2CP-C) TaxID=290397 RepID=Q2IDQ8_ANADE|nr:hypothetical protein [Anaeromyxobacter dehalogenans]ABC82717.1 hypothetical protein Adeh_2947 [Anaeromyxobacter dehalogenans 2CP-C]
MEPSRHDNRANGRRRRKGGGGRRIAHGPRSPHPHIPLTDEGTPAAIPDAPPVSPVVFVSEESRRRYPWIPPRVIAGSVWRGPGHERVRVDEHGDAAPWKTVQRAG